MASRTIRSVRILSIDKPIVEMELAVCGDFPIQILVGESFDVALRNGTASGFENDCRRRSCYSRIQPITRRLLDDSHIR